MKSNTSRMDLYNAAPKKKKANRRLSFMEKSAFIVQMIGRNVDYHEALHGHRAFGFTMGQIASMTRYAPSTALMNDLYAMCDQKALKMDVRASRYTGISATENVFYLPASWSAKAHKARKMI